MNSKSLGANRPSGGDLLVTARLFFRTGRRVVVARKAVEAVARALHMTKEQFLGCDTSESRCEHRFLPVATSRFAAGHQDRHAPGAFLTENPLPQMTPCSALSPVAFTSPSINRSTSARTSSLCGFAGGTSPCDQRFVASIFRNLLAGQLHI